MSYTITELSKMFHLPASTLRYYEKIGLLENVEHVNSYRRVYDESHVDRLNAIECFKKALLPLDEIKAFFTYEKDLVANSEKILDMMKTQEEKTLETMKDLHICRKRFVTTAWLMKLSKMIPHYQIGTIYNTIINCYLHYLHPYFS